MFSSHTWSGQGYLHVTRVVNVHPPPPPPPIGRSHGVYLGHITAALRARSAIPSKQNTLSKVGSKSAHHLRLNHLTA